MMIVMVVLRQRIVLGYGGSQRKYSFLVAFAEGIASLEKLIHGVQNLKRMFLGVKLAKRGLALGLGVIFFKARLGLKSVLAFSGQIQGI